MSINENIATVTIIPTEVGLLTGSITFNGEATCNININVQGGYTVSPSTITQTEANQRCYTNIKNNGSTIYYGDIHNSDLILNYVKNNATDVIVARGGVDNSATSETTGNTLMLVRSGNSSGNINFMAYTDELPNGSYTVKFTYTDSNSDTHELYVTFVMAIPEPPVITVTPSTISENGVVGQATSFDLTLSGGSTYTYTQTFGNICNVSINGDTATVTITPITSGTLTGSITFNEEATCNITIAVSEPTPPPTGGFNPTSINVSMARSESETCYFELLSGSYDSDTESVDFSYTITNTSTDGDIRDALNISEDISTPPEYHLILESNNEIENTLTGVVNVYAKIHNADFEVLRTYTATINVTIGA